MPCNIINFTSFRKQKMVLFIKQGVSAVFSLTFSLAGKGPSFLT